MDSKKEKIKEMVKMGKWNFVFTYGLVRFGAIMFFFFILWDKFILEYKIDNSIIINYFVVCFIVGLFFGLWGWSHINKQLKNE